MPEQMKNLFSYAFILISLLFSSCEKERENPIDSNALTSYVLSATLTYFTFNLDSASSTSDVIQLPNGQFTITDTLRATIASPLGISSIKHVQYRIIAPAASSYFTSGKLSQAAGGSATIFQYTGIFSITLDRTDIGRYQVDVSATNQDGSESNALHIPLFITRNNSTPQLGTPSIRKYTPAGSDSTRLSVTIAASDSNGFSDITLVKVRTRNAIDSSLKTMYDNGNSMNGDQLTGDGIFSAITWMTPTLVLDSVKVEFVAIDSKSAQSPIVSRSLLNYPPSITNVIVPDSIQRPTSGFQLITFLETVTDPDGLGDIDSVYFRNFSSQTPTNFYMYDDGNLTLHGDSTANDGTYSLIVRIDPSTTLGNKEFHFYVVDKSGATSSLTRFIKIY